MSAGSGVEKLLTPAGAAGAATKMIPRVARAAGTEFLTEGTQGGQEQLAENLALQRAGYDVPTLRGVAGAATGEGLAGLLGAAPVAAIRGPGDYAWLLVADADSAGLMAGPPAGWRAPAR